MRTATCLVWISSCLFSITSLAAACDGFVDVDSSATYCTAVTYVQQRGVTIGCTDSTHYCPNDYVTRAQMALFLQRMGQADSTNTLGDHTTAIGGGQRNVAAASYAAVGGGNKNQANSYASVVSGGEGNVVFGNDGTVTGGYGNAAGGTSSAVVGGTFNSATGPFSAVLGGYQNTASGDTSLAAGNYAYADQDSCAVFSFWSQSTSVGMNCVGMAGSVRFAADHGVSIDYGVENSNGGGSRYVYFGNFASGVTIGTWTGAVLTDAGVWTNVSDRNVKHNFAPINSEDVLARVVAMPVTRWEYKVENGVTHIGPVAQDFFAAFDVGADDRHITTIDESGVALAAIQGLNAKLEVENARLDKTVNGQARELAEVKATLASVQEQVSELHAERRQGSAEAR